MSKERQNQFNKVLRPYYSFLSLPGLDSAKAFYDLFDKFLNDQEVSKWVRNEIRTVDQVYTLLDADNQKIYDYNVKLRFFLDCFAYSCAESILKNTPSKEIIAFCKDIQEQIKFSSDNERDYFLIGNLAQILTLALGIKIQNYSQSAFTIPTYTPNKDSKTAGVFVDTEPNNITISLLSNVEPRYNQLYTFAYNPEQLQSQIHNKELRSLTTRFNIFKSLLSVSAGYKVAFDSQGRVNNTMLPKNIAKDFFITRSISSTINETNADVFKFALTNDIMSFLHAADSRKSILRKKVTLLAAVNYTSFTVKNTINFNFQDSFADAALVAEYIQFIQNLKQPYKIQLQYEATSMCRLHILATPIEASFPNITSNEQ